MENNTFKIGDVVILKSGGPHMTITHEQDENNYVECTWFVNGKKVIDEFHVVSLKLPDYF